MKTKELQEKIVKNMKTWQKIEDASVANTGAIMEKTDNPIIRTVMEIIQNDSKMHYRVQQFIADSFEKASLSLNIDELNAISEMVENHLQIEKRMVGLVKESLAAIQGKKMLVQEYLLDYLMEDEEKHNRLLENLGKIKSGIYPYA
ncbi:MAG: hypothetical protein GXP58_00870 [Deltaproteobacteria bacterium]|nr:hypothetical protein [Deltaproteobacteria bacterium]